MKEKEKQEFQCRFTMFKRNETKMKIKTEKKIVFPWKTEYMRTKKNTGLVGENISQVWADSCCFLFFFYACYCFISRSFTTVIVLLTDQFIFKDCLK